MLSRIIEWSLRNQFLVVVAMLFAVVGGIWSVQQTVSTPSPTSRTCR